MVLEHLPSDDPDPVLERRIRSVKWGLVPSWSKEPKLGRLFNARAETVTVKPSFRAAAAKRRCVLPADGYYEWQAKADGKQPFFLNLDGAVLNMAGLYELWRDPGKDNDDPTRWLWTTTVLTATVILRLANPADDLLRRSELIGRRTCQRLVQHPPAIRRGSAIQLFAFALLASSSSPS